jgi:actin-related protein
LKPKKEHTGYVVCSSSERDYTFRLNRKNHKIVLWETVLQSPYPIDFTEEQARKQITEELFEQDENGKFFISRIGVTASYAAGFASMVSDNEWADEYKKYNVMLERKLRMNFRVGYWEIAFYHTKPLNCVPKDMRMC